jgi:hypothetical protein
LYAKKAERRGAIYLSGLFPPLRKGSADRHARINKLATMMRNKGDKTEKEILAKFCYEEAVSIRIAREYLEILYLAGIIKRGENEENP